MMFGNAYKNRRVLITGHTGFKGSWLALWLQMLGAKVTGISLPPETSPSHWMMLELDLESCYVDIRDEGLLRQKILEVKPEVVFHLAAQSLVRRSYDRPLETWATNVIGAANVLDACREVEELAAVVVITTDKCYENKERVLGYRESDSLGGHDPYSASKASSELLAASYRSSFFNAASSPLLASARAGNVIGGGDWSEDRLIPDLVRAVAANTSLEVRSPKSTRPWQHIFDCLSGYLMLGQQLLEGNQSCSDAWNFGPVREDHRQVQQVLAAMKTYWADVKWSYVDTPQPHETQLLHLDSGKAREKLLWRPVWTFDEGVAATAEWYKAWLDQSKMASLDQLQNYIKLAQDRGLEWTGNQQ